MSLSLLSRFIASSGVSVAASLSSAAVVEKALEGSALLGIGKAAKKRVSTLMEPALSGQCSYDDLNMTLRDSVYICGEGLTVVDVAVYETLAAQIGSWGRGEQLRLCNVTRWFDYVQHDKTLRAVADVPALVPIELDIAATVASTASATAASDAGAGGAAAPAGKGGKGGGKKGKGGGGGDSKGDAPAAPPGENADDPMLRLELRVGRIVECDKHPEADSLYVEKIDLGEPDGPRTVVSGLVNFVPLEEMRGALVVAMCNLKPAKMRGITSYAMVLCASNDDHTKVELLRPPADAPLGELLTVPGYSGAEPDKQIKKPKVVEDACAGMSVNGECVLVYKGVPFRTSAGPMTVKSLAGATKIS